MLELKAWIGNLGAYNAGHLLGEWVTFPIDEDESVELLKRIGVANEKGEIYRDYFIADYDCEFDAGELIGDCPSINCLNEIAEFLDKWDEKAFLSACEYALFYGETMEDLLEKDPCDWLYFSWINNEKELGEYFFKEIEGGYQLPEFLESYFDFKKYGSDVNTDYYGVFTDYGWIAYVG